MLDPPGHQRAEALTPLTQGPDFLCVDHSAPAQILALSRPFIDFRQSIVHAWILGVAAEAQKKAKASWPGWLVSGTRPQALQTA